MLIIPFDRPIDWRSPPWATLSLVAINLLVFFALQWNDDEHLLDALDYQYHSGLAAMELTHYRGFLKARGNRPRTGLTHSPPSPSKAWISPAWRDRSRCSSMRAFRNASTTVG